MNVTQQRVYTVYLYILGLSKLLKNDIRMFVWKKITNSNYSNIWLPILRSCRQYVNNATKPWFKLVGYIYII